MSSWRSELTPHCHGPWAPTIREQIQILRAKIRLPPWERFPYWFLGFAWRCSSLLYSLTYLQHSWKEAANDEERSERPIGECITASAADHNWRIWVADWRKRVELRSLVRRTQDRRRWVEIERSLGLIRSYWERSDQRRSRQRRGGYRGVTHISIESGWWWFLIHN